MVGPYRGVTPPSTWNGGLIQSHFGGGLWRGRGLSPVRQVVLPLGPRQRLRCSGSAGRGSLQSGLWLTGRYPGGMLSRTDIGAFPSKRWKGVTKTPQAIAGLASRAEPQAARKVRQSVLSSSMASVSKCCMSLACVCWIQWDGEAPQDSASLMTVEQQSSASAKVLAWLASTSLYTSDMADVSLAYQCHVMCLCFPDGTGTKGLHFPDRTTTEGLCCFYGFSDLRLIEAKSHPNSEVSFLLWASMVDLIANRCSKSLLASSQSWVTSKGGITTVLWHAIRMGGGGMDVLQHGIIHFLFIWDTHLRGGIHWFSGVIWFEDEWWSQG